MSNTSLHTMFARKARGNCPFCNKWGPFTFKDRLSEREFAISGLCQECQDKTFVDPDAPTDTPEAAYVTSFEEHQPIADTMDPPDDHSAPLPREQELEDAGTTAEEVNQFKKEGW